MEIDFLEYKVRNGDTLKSVASRLGMTAEELRIFHNAHCQRMSKIWFENLHDIKSIIVPTNFKTEKEKAQEKENILFPVCVPDSFYAKKYSVSETFDSPFETPVHIDYSIDLSFREDRNSGYRHMSYQAGNFKTKGKTPEDKVSSLSISCMKSIMPIGFLLSNSGQISGLENHKKFTEVFAEQRKELDDFFTGEVNRKYLDTFEKSISDEHFLLQQFRNTLLFQVLFPKTDWFRRKTAWTESFHFLQNSFPVRCKLKSEHSNDSENTVVTSLKGNIEDSCSSREIMRGIRSKDPTGTDENPGEISIEYSTHKKNKNLLQAGAILWLKHEEELVYQHSITITQG